jgi:hypothetical protein
MREIRYGYKLVVENLRERESVEEYHPIRDSIYPT